MQARARDPRLSATRWGPGGGGGLSSAAGGEAPRGRSYISHPTCNRREGWKSLGSPRLRLSPSLRPSRRVSPPRPWCILSHRVERRRSGPRGAEQPPAPRRRFKRSAGPRPGAAVVRPALRSSPLFPPWFLSAPVSNLAPGAPLACLPAARRPGPRRRRLPPVDPFRRPSQRRPGRLSPLRPCRGKLSLKRGEEGNMDMKRRIHLELRNRTPAAVSRARLRAPSPSDDLHVMVATCGAPGAGSPAPARGRAQLAGSDGEGGLAGAEGGSARAGINSLAPAGPRGRPGKAVGWGENKL